MTREEILREFKGVEGINEAKKIYKQLAKKLHPDVGGDEESFKLLNAIYNDLIEHKIYFSNESKFDLELEKIYALYKDFYKDSPFVRISEKPIDMKQVVNTNFCVIQIEKQGNRIAVHSAIDNLLKGASGQAVQNMNIANGWEQNLGLNLKPIAF